MARYRHPGLLLCCAPVGELQVGVVGTCYPGFTAGAKDVVEPAPGVAAGLAHLGNSFKLPKQLTIIGVVSADVAVLRDIACAACKPQDDLAICDYRPRRIRKALAVIRNYSFPYLLTGARIQSNQAGIRGGLDDLVLVHRNIPHVLAIGWATPVLPDEFASFAIQRLDNVTGINQVDNPVVDQWRGFRVALMHIPDPLKGQVAHIVLVDLIERAVGVGVIVATMHGPVIGAGVSQHGIAKRDKGHKILGVSGNG